MDEKRREMALAMLTTRLDMEATGQTERLVAQLKSLAHDIARAIEAAGSGDRVNAHLIANAAMLTETIARYNLARELAPLVKDAAHE